MVHRELVERADDLVHHMRKALGAGDAAAVLHQHRFGGPAAGCQPLLEQVKHGGADRRCRAVAVGHDGQFGKIAAQRFAVDQLVELQGGFGHLGGSDSLR